MYTDLNPKQRVLLGPGPSTVHPRTLRAMSTPMIGHMDPQFIAIMNEVQELLRYVFQTENQLTIPISGSGSAGMEASLVNFLEPGDDVVIGVIGYFGERLCDMATRIGANVRRIERPWGEAFAPDEIEAALSDGPVKMVALVHAETSTGVLQPLEGMADVIHRHGALFLVDAVASLGGTPVNVDGMDIDICYSGSQKGLSAPPGLAPITVNDRAREVLRNRKSAVPNWYLDLSMVEKYWGTERTYHHTAPISMNYALREALRLIHEEGLEACWARHREQAERLWIGLEALGFELVVPEPLRTPTLTTVWVPEGVDDATVRKTLLNEYSIEIAGGLGAFKGKAWRVGLMGYSAQHTNVTLLLGALKEILGK